MESGEQPCAACTCMPHARGCLSQGGGHQAVAQHPRIAGGRLAMGQCYSSRSSAAVAQPEDAARSAHEPTQPGPRAGGTHAQSPLALKDNPAAEASTDGQGGVGKAADAHGAASRSPTTCWQLLALCTCTVPHMFYFLRAPLLAGGWQAAALGTTPSSLTCRALAGAV